MPLYALQMPNGNFITATVSQLTEFDQYSLSEQTEWDVPFLTTERAMLDRWLDTAKAGSYTHDLHYNWRELSLDQARVVEVEVVTTTS